MVVQYLPIAMVGLALVQSILLLCILVQVRHVNKQQPSATQKKTERPEKTEKIEKHIVATSPATASPILPWLRHASRDDMINSFRVLAEAQQNERK